MNEVSGSRLKPGVVRAVHISGHAEISRSSMAQRVLAVQNLPLSQCRVWNARQTNLPGTASSDDLGYITGTLGTDSPSVQTSDLKNLGATTMYAGIEVEIPEDYEDGETFSIVLPAGMKTTVASTTATIDVQAYLINEDGTVSSDLCNTAAQSINNLTAAEKSFTITPDTLFAGGRLDVRIAIAVNDTGTGTAVIGALYGIKILCDRR